MEQMIIAGGLVDPFDLTAIEKIPVGVIVESLAKQCRYNGHVPRFYSVAEHSVFCARVGGLISYAVARQCLVHDFHEVIVGDIVSPIKSECPKIADLCRAIDSAILKRWNLGETWDPMAIKIDIFIRHIEQVVFWGAFRVGDQWHYPVELPNLYRSLWPLFSEAYYISDPSAVQAISLCYEWRQAFHLMLSSCHSLGIG